MNRRSFLQAGIGAAGAALFGRLGIKTPDVPAVEAKSPVVEEAPVKIMMGMPSMVTNCNWELLMGGMIACASEGISPEGHYIRHFIPTKPIDL